MQPQLPSQMLFEVLASVSRTVAWIVAALVTLVWLVALFQKAANAQRLDKQTGIESIHDLTWQAFEQLLAEAYRRQGYRVRDTGPGADGGVDLILEREGRRTLVQAKQWKTWKVGVQTVRELFGIQTAQRADEAMLVTSGQFTYEARRFADENGVTLIDGDMLVRMISEVQRSRPADTQPAEATMVGQPAVAPNKPLACPTCGQAMVRRVARRGANVGQAFWGCARFPACKGIRSIT